MSAREKAAAKAKLKEREAADLFERTGIRDESADWSLENMMDNYEYEMARQELQQEKKMKKKPSRRTDDIDPETGKPRERSGEFEDRANASSDDDADREYEEIARRHPKLATEEFREYLQKQKESKEKQEELYGDDEPYDAVADEKHNDEEQAAFIHDKLAQLAKEEAKAEVTEGEPTPAE